MKKRDLKKEYFKKGSTALRKLGVIDLDCYCCPICHRLYLPGALDTGELTLEHAPPERVGGKPLALTCKECNSVAGYSVDLAVVNRQRQFDFTRAVIGHKTGQNLSARGTLSIAGEKLNVRFEVNDDAISIIPPRENNDPQKMKNFKNTMMHLHQTDTENGQQFTITPTIKYFHKHSKVGDLKAAFIICFAFFGYAFALNKRLLPVRQQIMNYDKTIIKGFWFASDPNVNQEHFICLTETPVVALTVKLDHAIIVLPWLEGPNDIYGYLGDNYKSNERVDFSGRYFSWPLRLEMRLDYY